MTDALTTEAAVHTALYRRFRPGRFAEVVGQPGPTRALSNAVTTEHVAHAYLFSGPRGTGKTSVARILARALNCETPLGGEPCGVCQSCVAIERGSSIDVTELDAASNNGVDNIRDLTTRAAYAPNGNKRIFILDEAHMLSTAAANALLKTLEEPPPHVIFVLATTDPQKLMPTIKSRCQHLQFRLVAPEEMTAHLHTIAQQADLDVGDDVIDEAVRSGGGSVRDALSALDALAAAGGDVEDMALRSDLADALVSGNVADALAEVAKSVQLGIEPRRLAEETIAELRELFLCQMGASELCVTPDTGLRAERAKEAGTKRTVASMEHLGDAVVRITSGNEPRVALEISVVRACRANAASSSS